MNYRRFTESFLSCMLTAAILAVGIFLAAENFFPFPSRAGPDASFRLKVGSDGAQVVHASCGVYTSVQRHHHGQSISVLFSILAD